MVTDIDKHIATKKLKLNNASSCISFFSTVWKGEVISFTVCTINYEIQSIFCIQQLYPEDVDALTDIIYKFFGKDILEHVI